MKALKAIDEYFIGAGEGTARDRVAIYGQYLVYVGIAAFTALSIY